MNEEIYYYIAIISDSESKMDFVWDYKSVDLQAFSQLYVSRAPPCQT